jgi:SNF2 family DNA or RNA helicase
MTPRDPLEPRDPEALRGLLREVMIRNTRAASGVGLPPRRVRTIVVEPGPAERALYDELVALSRQGAPTADGEARAPRGRTLLRLLLEEAGSSARAVARTAEGAKAEGALAEGLRRVATAARAVEGSRKLDWLLELIPGGKLLVFTRFLATHEMLLDALAARGVAAVGFTGGMSAARRAEAVAAFRGPVDVMVCSEVGGEGQNLQFCHRLVNFDLPWNPMLIEQRVGRLHRIGQAEEVEIVNLCTAGTAEERILSVLDQRVGLFELVVGELDLIVGDVEDERDFGEQVFEIYAGSRTDDEVARGFDALGERLAAARQQLDRTKAAAAATFGDELGA